MYVLGYNSNKKLTQINQAIKQNLKTLILTDKGERIMLPNFGVGLKKFLFENFSQTTTYQIESEIKSQVKKYMPFVNVVAVNILEDPDNLNKLYVSVNFTVPALNAADILIIG